MDSIVSPKVKTVEGKRVWAHSLAHSTSGGRGACSSSGMGINKSDKQLNYLHGPTQTKSQVG